jgi:pimeloyl-ACP methyl ester carboxylesterase/DNA-binding winged helix-turn-helix (wHTH) protein
LIVATALPPESAVTFGGFCLDPASGQLYRDGTAVPLTPKAFSVLQHLATRAGRLVSKQDLLDAVWPGVFVGDAVLKVSIREIRRALGDDSHTPQFIETAHRRGYRFIAPIEATAPTRTAALAPSGVPRVHYAQSGSVNIAYQVVGSGDVDIVFVMGWVSHLEYFWNEPSFARFLTRLASMGRLILFDKRGTGLSDAVPVDQLPTLEQRLDDVRAVMEAAGSERAALIGVSEGAPLCALFAATYPERTEALVAIGSYARRLKADDYPWGETREEREAFFQSLLEQWGGPVGIEERAPSRAADPAFREWWASYLRMGASPGAAVALTRMNAEIDVRAVLPSIKVPTLVLHRRGDRLLKVEEARYIASKIPTATLVELPGDDHLPFVGNQDEMLDEIEKFLSATHPAPAAEHVLATVLTLVAPVPPSERGRVRSAFSHQVAAHRGRTVETTDERLVAAFDGPGRAVRCGTAVIASIRDSQTAVRAGVHIGEYDPSKPGGSLLADAAAIAAAAAAGEVLVSRTVVDLVPGSGLQFADRGVLRVPGLKRDLAVLAVARETSSVPVTRGPAARRR